MRDQSASKQPRYNYIPRVVWYDCVLHVLEIRVIPNSYGFFFGLRAMLILADDPST